MTSWLMRDLVSKEKVGGGWGTAAEVGLQPPHAHTFEHLYTHYQHTQKEVVNYKHWFGENFINLMSTHTLFRPKRGNLWVFSYNKETPYEHRDINTYQYISEANVTSITREKISLKRTTDRCASNHVCEYLYQTTCKSGCHVEKTVWIWGRAYGTAQDSVTIWESKKWVLYFYNEPSSCLHRSRDSVW